MPGTFWILGVDQQTKQMKISTIVENTVQWGVEGSGMRDESSDRGEHGANVAYWGNTLV